MRRSALTLSLILLCIALVPSAGARQAAELPIAAIRQGNVWLYGVNGESRQLTVVTGSDRYERVAWSPDGRLLVFSGQIAARGDGISLLASSLTGAPSVQLAFGLHPLLPVTFTPNSSAVVYAIPVPEAATSTVDVVEVYRYTPSAGSAPVYVGSFNVVKECHAAAGPPLPTDYRLALETGSRAWPRYVMAMLPFGLLYSANCNPPDLWLLNPNNGETVPLFVTVDGVFVAPDQTRAVVTLGNLLAFVNTERGPYTQITPAAKPDQVGFGADPGDVFYSTRALVGPTPLPDGLQDVLGNFYFQMPLNYEVTIRRFSLRTGRDDLLYTADAYGIGRLALTADGGTLLFSQVPNADAWVQAVANGLIAPDDLAAAEPYVTSEIYALSLADGRMTQIGSGWEQFTLNPAAAISTP